MGELKQNALLQDHNYNAGVAVKVSLKTSKEMVVVQASAKGMLKYIVPSCILI